MSWLSSGGTGSRFTLASSLQCAGLASSPSFAHKPDGYVGAELLHHQSPLLRNVSQAVQENNVIVGVGERLEVITVLLPCCVPRASCNCLGSTSVSAM